MHSAARRQLSEFARITPMLLAICLQIFGEETVPGITYNHLVKPEIPWSIHVLKIDRSRSDLEIHSAHAGKAALSLGTLTDQLALYVTNYGCPVASINGDFYQREGLYAGDPHSLQVADGELLSGANGRVVFWLDPFGQPHATNISSRFLVHWPNGATSAFGLNEDHRTNAIVLYTPSAGSSTHTTNDMELVLELIKTSQKYLRVGRTYSCRVVELHHSGNSSLHSGQMVLSIRPDAAAHMPTVKPGQELIISTATSPSLQGLKVAIGGGPVLLRNGVRQKIPAATSASYEFTSMHERHPRSAIGWNHDYYFLIEVDGRQPKLSMGMTLAELAAYMAGLGCTDAVNLDGGGSATLWYDGKVRNSPCDGHERPIANSLVISKKAVRREGRN